MDQTGQVATLNSDPEVELVSWLHDVGRLIKSVNSRCRSEETIGAEFLKRDGPAGAPDEQGRTVAAVLFADIAGATETVAQIGDAAWRDLLIEFQRRTGRTLDRFHGRLVDSAGDGIFAVFHGPACAVRCALALHAQAAEIGLRTRAGVHIGEVERFGRKFGGIAVHIAARIMALAAGGEVLVSSTVKDIVVGSGLQFEDRGPHELRGVPDKWRLFLARQA